MSLNRQFGMQEIPGTEQPVLPPAKTTVSAGFELQMRADVSGLWQKLAEMETRIADLTARGDAEGESSTALSPPKPWEIEGVSRRTWYRRREARAGG